MHCTLEQLAGRLGVNARTVRRYLEKGWLPEAYRTKGGHWRVPGETAKIALILAQRSGRQVRAMRKRMRGAGKSIRTGHTIAEVAQVLAVARARRIPIHAAASHSLTEQVSQAIAAHPRYYLLLGVLFRLKKTGSSKNRLTVTATARQLGISRQRFYREYGVALLNDAKKEVARMEITGLIPSRPNERGRKIRLQNEGEESD